MWNRQTLIPPATTAREYAENAVLALALLCALALVIGIAKYSTPPTPQVLPTTVDQIPATDNTYRKTVYRHTLPINYLQTDNTGRT